MYVMYKSHAHSRNTKDALAYLHFIYIKEIRIEAMCMLYRGIYIPLYIVICYAYEDYIDEENASNENITRKKNNTRRSEAIYV